MRFRCVLSGGVLMAAGVSFATIAAAEPFSATLTLTSDYRFRGVSQNDRDPAPQGEVDWNGSDGSSAGVFTSKMNFNDHADTSFEVDLYGGKHWQFDDATLTATAYYYSYPNHKIRSGAFRYSTLESDLQYARTWDAYTFTGTLAASPEYFGNHGVAWYAAVGSSYAVSSNLTVSANVGRQSIHAWDEAVGDGVPYVYWDAGASYVYADFTVDIRYVDTTLSMPECLRTFGGTHWCEAGAIATISYAIGSVP